MALNKPLEAFKANAESAKRCKAVSKAYTKKIAEDAIKNTPQPSWS